MNQTESRGRLFDAGSDGTRGLRRVAVTAGLVLVAIYAGAFIMLAPMMQ
jgi:hypothetical protein